MKRFFITFFTVALVSLSVVARQPKSGYRGFIDYEGNMGSQYEKFSMYNGFSTTHGYQINPMFYVGAGFSMQRCTKWDTYLFPLYLRGRADFKFTKYTPFTDLSIGYNATDGGGLYYSQNIGYRFNWGRKVGVNVGAGISLRTYKVEMYDITINEDFSWDVNYLGVKKQTNVFFSIKLGFDF